MRKLPEFSGWAEGVKPFGPFLLVGMGIYKQNDFENGLKVVNSQIR
jgi:hypothetical protein